MHLFDALQDAVIPGIVRRTYRQSRPAAENDAEHYAGNPVTERSVVDRMRRIALQSTGK
jgi:hypothetical protein